MEATHINSKRIFGLSTRTTNADELDASTAKIGALWQNYLDKYQELLVDNPPLYGVYTEYQSDANGEYTLYVGAENGEIGAQGEQKSITIDAGNYLVFSAKGEMPAAVIEAWRNVWQYFQQVDSLHERAYTTDFECYSSNDAVDVYIAIK